MSLKKYKKFLMVNAVLAIAVQNTGCGKEAIQSKVKDEHNTSNMKEGNEVRYNCCFPLCCVSSKSVDREDKLREDLSKLKEGEKKTLNTSEVADLFGFVEQISFLANDKGGVLFGNVHYFDSGSKQSRENNKVFLVSNNKDVLNTKIHPISLNVNKKFRFSRNNFGTAQEFEGIGLFKIVSINGEDFSVKIERSVT